MPSSFQSGLEEAVRNGVCDVSRQGVAAGIIIAGVTAETGAGIAAGLAIAAAGALTYASFCNNPLPPEYLPHPPFSGGQCDAVRYKVTTRQHYTDTRNGMQGEQAQVNVVIGPIYSINFRVDTQAFNQTYLVINAKGDSVNTVVNPAFSDNNVTGVFNFSNFRTEIVREDGQADNCGSPPPVSPPPPPGGSDYHTTINYNDNSSNPISIPVTIGYGAGSISVNGTLNVPITLRFGGDGSRDAGGDLNLTNNTINFNFGDPANPLGQPGGGSPPDIVVRPVYPPPPPINLPPFTPIYPAPGPGDPRPPTLVPSPPVPPGDTIKAERRKLMRGALVTTLLIGSNSSVIFQGANPDIYIPALGYIQFLIQIGQATGWTHEIAIKNVRQIVQCPWDLGAIEVRGTVRGNGQFTITPIYTSITYNPRFPPES